MRMSFRPIHSLLVLLAAGTLAACGGGGGGGGSTTPPTPVPTATPTINPSCRQLSPQSGGSTYTLQSAPSGLVVQRVDPSVTSMQCVYFTGTTTTSDTPQTAPHAWNYVFAPSQASPFTVVVAQTLNGPHTLFYNQIGDSSGSISVSSLQSIRRATSASRALEPQTLRGLHRFTGAGVAPSIVLVRYRGGATQMRARANQIEAAEGAAATGIELTTVGGSYERFVTVPAGTDAATFASKLRTQSDVVDVFPVHKRFALGRPAFFVTDPHMQNGIDQWYLFDTGFPHAWSYATGSNAKIAFIDTGIDLNNTDLTAHFVGGKTFNHTGSAADASCGGSANTNTTPQDTNGHGTNTAGIATAGTNDLFGFAGAGFNVKLLAYDIFQNTTATSDSQTACVPDEIAAIQAAVAAGADVINLSLGAASDYGSANGWDQGEHDAIEAAIAAGVTVVAAAGNDADGGESGTPHTVLDYPAAYDGVIAVGASALKDNNTQVFAGSTEYVAKYSQYGPTLAVVAPGGDPTGTSDLNPLHWIWNYSTTTANFPADQCKNPFPPTNCSAFFAGTSQSTPHVSAAAALLISAARTNGFAVPSPARIQQIIQDTADNINDPHQGHGRLNIYKAIATLFTDTGAYTGPTTLGTSPTQVVAFAYDNIGSVSATPHIVDVDYPNGVPIDSSGNFRIADVPTTVTNYHVGVWYDANGDGVVDAGDQFGSAAVTCNGQAKCTIGTITMHTITGAFKLP